jgi:hypothetical protein
VAAMIHQHEFFYQAESDLAEKLSGIKETQSIRVFKDDTSYRFDGKPKKQFFSLHIIIRISWMIDAM